MAAGLTIYKHVAQHVATNRFCIWPFLTPQSFIVRNVRVNYYNTLKSYTFLLAFLTQKVSIVNCLVAITWTSCDYPNQLLGTYFVITREAPAPFSLGLLRQCIKVTLWTVQQSILISLFLCLFYVSSNDDLRIKIPISYSCYLVKI